MSLATAATFARRELRGGLRGFRIFLACLALGVATVAAIGSVRASIEAGLQAEGATMLGGDAEIELTYRFADDSERAWMQSTAAQVSEIVDFRSMATVTRNGATERGLTQVKAVDNAYPLTGTVELDPPMPLSEALANVDGLPGAVMAPLLIGRLNLALGDTFRLGETSFRLTAALVVEPDAAGAGFALGPRTLVATNALSDSGLLLPGTLFSTRYRMLLPDDLPLSQAQTDAKSGLEGSGIRWRDSRNGAPGIAAFVERLGGFLILVGLAGMAVGGIGVSAAVRAYLERKTTVIAILRSLGASFSTVYMTYLIQIGMLALIGIGLGVLLGAALPILLAPLIQEALPLPVIFTIYPRALAEAALYGILTALIFTLWPLARTRDVKAAELFRNALGSARMLPAPAHVLAIGGFLVLLVACAAILSGSARLTLWTVAGVLCALVLLSLAAILIRALARNVSPPPGRNPPLRWAVNALAGPREAIVPVVLSLGLGLSVLATVGQVDGNLRNAIARDLPDVAPSFFFVDIQKNQMPVFLERLQGDPAVSRLDSAPMLRGVITRINGRPAAEVAGDHWVLEGDRGVTYSERKPDSTTVTQGNWWPENHTGDAQISFADEEAEEMGLKLGDTLTVNILGRDITGTITSFREVDFSTAGMGFVLAMNPAALAGAPHSFIATVYADEVAEATILRDLSNAFPNITAISVRDAIDRVSGLLAALADAIAYGASAMLLTGFLVLMGAAAAGQGARTYEAAILKTLGASRRQILLSIGMRAALLGSAAGTVALATGIIGGWAVGRFVLDTGYSVIWPSAIGIVLGGIFATLVASLFYAAAPLRVRPGRILRARE